MLEATRQRSPTQAGWYCVFFFFSRRRRHTRCLSYWSSDVCSSDLDIQALRDLQLAHLLTVPFENLSIHLGEPIVLEQADLVAKVVRMHRGGFCYELNGAFAGLLTALGFRVSMLSARVFGTGGQPGPPFDHMT